MAIAGIQTLGIEMGLARLERRMEETEANALANITGRDLDETRRLLYMALMRSYTDRYVLAGTLVNALCHHNLMLDVDEAIEHVGKLLGYTSDENRQWARDTIDKLTARMADED